MSIDSIIQRLVCLSRLYTRAHDEHISTGFFPSWEFITLNLLVLAAMSLAKNWDQFLNVVERTECAYLSLFSLEHEAQCVGLRLDCREGF